jgi:perosamine synthetase
VGAEPVFVDVDLETWCLSAAAVEEAVTDRTKAIIAVDLYGHPADMDALNEVADRHGLALVEDAAEAHGARYKGRLTGSLGHIGTFSFYGNKIITSGEGGAITVDDPELERKIRQYRGQGVDPDRRYFFPVVGYNYRLTNVACALLCAQLERWDQIIAARGEIFARYELGLRGIAGLGLQPRAKWADPASWLFSITVDALQFGIDRDELARRLDDVGIETRPFFQPLHRLPPYVGRPGSKRALPASDELATSGLNLPTSSRMTEADVSYVTAAIRDIQRKGMRVK